MAVQILFLTAALLSPSHAAEVASIKTNLVPCKRVSILESDGWRRLEVCEHERNVHFGQYHHEAMVLPALVALGSSAKRALVIAGADGGVATQLLKSKDIEKVVVVTSLKPVTKLCLRHMSPIGSAFADARVEAIFETPVNWLKTAAADTEPFDIIIVERPWPGELPYEWDVPYEQLKALMSPKSLLVQHTATAWNLPRVRQVFGQLQQHFSRVVSLHSSTIEQFPWHDISFVAGSEDVLAVDWSWWNQQNISSIYYHKALHAALFVPPAIVSRFLGLQLPSKPDSKAAQQLDSLGGEAVALAFMDNHFELDDRGVQGTAVLDEKSKYQHLVMRQNPGYVSLFLDQELQLTSLYGDFYHEAHVHPAMAALGPRGQRVLVIGGGDGGVSTLALRYPIRELVQVEIDEMVVNASKRYMPNFSQGYSDKRTKLIIGDAIQWVRSAAASQELFDLCIIDTTDEPLNSPWSKAFFQDLKKLIAPHGAVSINIGSMGDWLDDHRDRQEPVFNKMHIINVNTPEYPSPYFLALLTDELDVYTVDWTYWSNLQLQTIYYHPTMHSALFELPLETKRFYEENKTWEPFDAQRLRKIEKQLGKRLKAEAKRAEL